MMLTIKCDTCGRTCQVDGYITPSTYYDPSEIVINDKEDFSSCCVCIQDCGEYEIVSEESDQSDF